MMVIFSYYYINLTILKLKTRIDINVFNDFFLKKTKRYDTF